MSEKNRYRIDEAEPSAVPRPCFPDLPEVPCPVAIVDSESAEAARDAMAVIDEHAALVRAFVRAGAEYRRTTGARVPIREWDLAHDRLHDLARLRERIQEKLGRYRRKATSFDRAFVEAARDNLPAPVLAEITAKAQESIRGGA